MRFLRHVLAAALLASVAGCLPAPGPNRPPAGQPSEKHPDDDYGAVADFTLLDQDGRTVRRDDLLGKVWVAAFVFTRCAGPCSQVSGSMARLQHELAGEKDVLLVSFTVDPEHDKPKVLKDYAARFGADPERWRFLTGEQKPLYELIEKNFMLAVQQNTGKNRTPGNEVTHSTKLVVVDRKGHLRGFYDGTDPEDVTDLRARVAKLIREKS
jgi:cytochrome oxidase Cu insertion factor (SCO1/SenC/PrrC family)